MKKFFALALIAVLFALAIPTTADARNNHQNGRVVQNECQTDTYGTYCRKVWRSDDGIVERGSWEYTSSDGSYHSEGKWWTNFLKGIYWWMSTGISRWK